METKTCTKCGECKPPDAFSKRKASRDGLCPHCKACQSECQRKRRAANPEKAREYYRKRYAANPEKVREKVRQWQAANPEKVREKVRQWQAANPEKKRESRRQWQVANPEKVRESSRKVREQITPAYVANLLGIPAEQLTPELLAIKREQILNQRVLRDLKQTLKDLTNEHEPNH